MDSSHGGTGRTSGRPRGMRRWLALVSSILILTGGAVVAGAQPAAALLKLITPSGWAYTDSRYPHTAYRNTSAALPVGAWRDQPGRVHISRSYVTYDLSSYLGKRIVSATLIARETKVNDCAKPRKVEIWTTTKIEPSTSWANPPKEKTKLGGIVGLGCPASYTEGDVTTAVRDAVARKQSTLTLELRVPKGQEANLHYGRSVEHTVGISIESNTAPDAPTALTIDGRTCTDAGVGYVNSKTPTIRATISDPDVNETGGGDYLSATFAVWPVDDPTARLEWTLDGFGGPTSVVTSGVPEGSLADGGSYAFAVRSSDGRDKSPWSAQCRFTVDATHPDRPPVVTSVDYPENVWTGGPGIAGNFTFSANGVTDVTGFRYGIWGPYSYVAAGAPGGSATVAITPTSDGPQVLYVYSIDRAGNVSDTAYYWLYVKNTAPVIVDTNPDAWAGDPHTLTFQPSMAGVASYTYRVDDGTERTVPAGADGTTQISVTPSPQGSTVYVRSTTTSGQVSSESWLFLSVSTAPIIESADFPSDGRPGLPIGTPGTFTFKPHMHGVVEYVYQFNQGYEDEEPWRTVAAGPDGSATVDFTGRRAYGNQLNVYARTAAGTSSEETAIGFYVGSLAPTVTSTAYPQYVMAGGPGVAGTFSFEPKAAGVAEYLYQFDAEPERTVAAAADGSATVSWTPGSYDISVGGYVTLLVRSRSGSGLVSDPAYYQFQINPLAPTVTSDVYQWPDGGSVGQAGTFTFTAQLSGSVEFVYSFDDEPDRTIAVGPDGTATVSWTPDTSYSHSLVVRSRTASGLTSGYGYTSIWVNP